MTEPVVSDEVRVLEGPNLYFTKPAVKVSLLLPGYLAAPTDEVRAIAKSLGLRARVGSPNSVQRQAFLQRLAQHTVRVVGKAAGTNRVGVRVRPGASPDHIIVAFVWRHRGRATVLGECLAPLLADLFTGADPEPVIADVVAKMAAAPAGRRATARVPKVPVASITGTNGKTTTTRLLAHISMTAGNTTSWSSTDGIVAQGVVIEAGDYSGPAGAKGVLDTPKLQLGVLETARGGLLLKGMGVLSNDVSVVTNVSADHLGLQGIDTLDQLAEVKAIVTTVTKPTGWTVLNGEDPRVWAMHTRSKGRPWAFALDPAAPALREALDAGGRGITVIDGDVTVINQGGATERILPLRDIPATLAGLSVHNVANVLAATAAALGLGIAKEFVAEGLRTFIPDDQLNPGRMNIYTLPTRDGKISVVLDLAHNEAGLEALTDVARGLCAPGGRVLLSLGTAGDRTDEILANLGEIAGKRADQVVIAHKQHYLRGRSLDEFEHHFGLGLARAGRSEVDTYPDELAGLAALGAMSTDGDVIAVMTHEQRLALVEWITERGGTADGAKDIRRKVRAAHGGHELDEEFAALAELEPDARLAKAEELLASAPEDPRVVFEHATVLDSLDRSSDAIAAYEHALSLRLREPHRHRARIQLAVNLAEAGRAEEASALFDALVHDRPESAAVTSFRALTAVDAGAAGATIADLVEALLARATDDDSQHYRAELLRQAARLRDGVPAL